MAIFFKEKFRLTGLKVFLNKAPALISLIEYSDGIEKINTTNKPIKKILKKLRKLKEGSKSMPSDSGKSSFANSGL